MKCRDCAKTTRYPPAPVLVGAAYRFVTNLQQICRHRNTADISRRRVGRLLAGCDPRTDVPIGTVTIPMLEVYDLVTSVELPQGIYPGLHMPILSLKQGHVGYNFMEFVSCRISCCSGSLGLGVTFRAVPLCLGSAREWERRARGAPRIRPARAAAALSPSSLAAACFPLPGPRAPMRARARPTQNPELPSPPPLPSPTRLGEVGGIHTRSTQCCYYYSAIEDSP